MSDKKYKWIMDNWDRMDDKEREIVFNKWLLDKDYIYMDASDLVWIENYFRSKDVAS